MSKNQQEVNYVVPGLMLEQSQVSQGSLRLRGFQADALRVITSHERCLLEVHAGTGMGKTAVAVLAALENNPKTAIMVYPTNELIRNQAQSIRKTCERIGLNDPQIVTVYSSELWKLMTEEDYSTKGYALRDKLYPPRFGQAKFVLTNPDTLHLILRLRYGGKARYGRGAAEVLKHLPTYSTLVIDEFHYYERRELSSIYFDLALARYFGAFERILLMTATPNTRIAERLDLLAEVSDMDRPDAVIAVPTDHGDQVAHEIEFTVIPAEDSGLDSMEDFLVANAETFRDLRRENPQSDFIPACVILNSVIDARSLTERLLGSFTMKEVRESHGLIPQQERKNREGVLILVGTSSIEVGIDFDTTFLLFEGSSAPSAIQRLGRVGRHRSGKAMIYAPRYVFKYFENYVSEIGSRGELVDHLGEAYGEKDPGIWYLDSPFAVREARYTVEELAKYAGSSSAAASYHSRDDLDEFFTRVFTEGHDVERSEDWFDVIDSVRNRLATLRSSQPLALVHDGVAERKGLFPVYFSPLSRVLRRAKRFNVYRPDDEKGPQSVWKATYSTGGEGSSTVEELLTDFRAHLSAGRKVGIVDVFGYMERGYRSIKMSYADRLPKQSSFRPIVGINKADFFGSLLGFELNHPGTEILDELFIDELFAIVDTATASRLGWQVESYPIYTDRSRGRVYFGGNALVALACSCDMERRRNREEQT